MLQCIYQRKTGGAIMKKIEFNVDETLLCNAEEVLDETGLDIGTAVRVMLKRVVRDGNASFLFANSRINSLGCNEEKNKISVSQGKDCRAFKMTKNKAVGLFKNNGVSIGGNVTFSSKNKASSNYWANPQFKVLDSEWFLILNDWMHRELYLFEIPARTFKHNQLISRADKRLIDLQIMYEDNSFTDIRSKISFAQYLKDRFFY